MQRDFDVIVVGEINADLILKGEVTPAFGQVEKLVDDATLTIGSSSAIFACGAARLGLKVAFIGKAGEDEFGRFMLREMNGRGIDISGVMIDPQIKTGLSVILSRGNDRAILTYLGSIAALRYDEIDWSLVQRARHIHVGSYYLLDGLRADVPRLFAKAHEYGMTTSLDTNYDPKETWAGYIHETLAQTDVFLPNEAELAGTSGQTDVESGLRGLGERVPLIAVKQGGDGAMAWRDGQATHQAGYPVQVVDTTGAGDSFDAGFIYGYLNGYSLERTLQLAAACGALSTRASGGTAAQATLDEAESLVHSR
jgi:sugar/nucleoside kinase (ribokinase family)